MPSVTEASRKPNPAAPLIVSLGAVHESKGIAKLISAFALFSARNPKARLVIAGPIETSARERWSTYAAERAPEADVQVTGHLSSGRYAALIAAADLAVQLRLVSNGEASATIADCLSVGLPTLVSDLGWAGELPAGVVSRLRVGATAVELARRLEQLVVDVELRGSLSEAGLNHARANSFAAVARSYIEALELN